MNATITVNMGVVRDVSQCVVLPMLVDKLTHDADTPEPVRRRALELAQIHCTKLHSLFLLDDPIHFDHPRCGAAARWDRVRGILSSISSGFGGLRKLKPHVTECT